MPTATHLATAASTTNASSYATASITPGANRLVLAAIAPAVGTAPIPTISLTGNSLTWVLIEDTQTLLGSANRGLWVFRAMGASPTAGAVTITAGAALGGCAWTIIEYDGVDTSGTNGSGAVVQHFLRKPTAATSVNEAFTGTVLASSSGFGAVEWSAQEAGTAGAGWSGQTAQHGAPSNAILGLYANTCPQNVAGSWTTSGVSFVAGVEVKAAATGGTVTGSGAATAQAATGSGAGTLTATGSGTATAAVATASGAGALRLTGTGAATVSAPVAAGAGSVTLTGAGAGTLAPATVTGVGVLTVTGAGELAVASATATGVGVLTITGVGAAAFPTVEMAGAASVAASRDITLSVGAGRSRVVTATAANSRALTAAGASRTLTAEPTE